MAAIETNRDWPKVAFFGHSGRRFAAVGTASTH
jgi:hypothetical protein